MSGCAWLLGEEPSTPTIDTGTPPLTDTGTPPPPVAQCPEASGFDEQGRTWTWSYSAAHASLSGEEGTWVDTLATYAPSADAVDVVVHTEADYEVPDYEDYTATIDTTYRCDAEGLWLLSTFTAFSYVVTESGNLREGTIEVTYSKPVLRLPATVERGVSWKWRAEAQVVATPGGSSSFTQEGSADIPTTAVVDVPAGNFPDALVIEVTVEGVTGIEYVADDVGWIYTGSAELLDYTIPSRYVP